jgi:iron complex transport system ATP-binding protein
VELRASALVVAYGRSRALDGVDLVVPSASWVCLIGPNGAGKSTALRALGGLVAPSSGTVRLGDDDPAHLTPRRRARLVAYVPQQPVVPDDLAVVDYVLLGRTAHVPTFGVESTADRVAVDAVLTRLELTAFASRTLGTLSGGELQRVVLARALAQDAPVLLLDEPTSALDVAHQQHVLDLVAELRRERGLTVVAAMHDLTLAGQYADVLVLLRDGRVRATGPADQVLRAEVLEGEYGARVTVLRLPDGTIAVVPRRT